MRWLGIQPRATTHVMATAKFLKQRVLRSPDASDARPRALEHNEETLMPVQANTFEIARRNASIGQGLLELPGIGELRLAWSATGLLMLALPETPPDQVEAAMVDRGIEAPELVEVAALYAHCLLAYAAGEPVEPASLPID